MRHLSYGSIGLIVALGGSVAAKEVVPACPTFPAAPAGFEDYDLRTARRYQASIFLIVDKVELDKLLPDGYTARARDATGTTATVQLGFVTGNFGDTQKTIGSFEPSCRGPVDFLNIAVRVNDHPGDCPGGVGTCTFQLVLDQERSTSPAFNFALFGPGSGHEASLIHMHTAEESDPSRFSFNAQLKNAELDMKVHADVEVPSPVWSSVNFGAVAYYRFVNRDESGIHAGRLFRTVVKTEWVAIPVDGIGIEGFAGSLYTPEGSVPILGVDPTTSPAPVNRINRNFVQYIEML